MQHDCFGEARRGAVQRDASAAPMRPQESGDAGGDARSCPARTLRNPVSCERRAVGPESRARGKRIAAKNPVLDGYSVFSASGKPEQSKLRKYSGKCCYHVAICEPYISTYFDS